RIYISLFSITLISFVVTGIVAAFDHFEHDITYNEERIAEKEKSIRASLEYLLLQNGGYIDTDSISMLLGDKVCELSEVNNLFITIYDLNGRYLVSMNTDTAEANKIPMQLSPELTNQIKTTTKTKAVILPSETNDTQNLAYWCFSDDYGRPLALVGMLYEKKEVEKAQLWNFMKEIGTTYIVLFILAAGIAFLITRDFTKSLSKLSESINHLKLGKKNEPLEWKSNDEIGQLIQEYNRMLFQLGASADKLAQQERETAWREMAQQVAHEIKNPLTPMKLRLQHLQRSWQDNPEEFQTRLNDFVQSMTDQIDTLSHIAQEFSNFAKMPQSVNERLNLQDIVKSVLTTFENENQTLSFHQNNANAAFIYGDKSHVIRVLNNLITNAIQSIPTERSKRMSLGLRFSENHVVIKISDNGSGISPEISKRIFMPNFTTRSTGSGLGLAMVKSIVIQMNGNVAFRTQVDKGSSFFVILPLDQKA
ncbi:MAG: HAMP domain-containing histidine kinase, partial [Flavobacteriales bacterium]|nr:HAMP domain-containing histidine kinase [Flavobacteriales bacterium]